MNIIGIDPDTKNAGIGIVRDGIPVFGTIARVPVKTAKIDVRRLQMSFGVREVLNRIRFLPEGENVQIIVVEGQEIYPDSPARPNDILALGQQAGAAWAIAQDVYPLARILVPLPRAWKGSGRKEEFTKQALRDLQLEVRPGGIYFLGSKARLPGTQGLSVKDAGHVVDALAMARWAWLRQPRSRA